MPWGKETIQSIDYHDDTSADRAYGVSLIVRNDDGKPEVPQVKITNLIWAALNCIHGEARTIEKLIEAAARPGADAVAYQIRREIAQNHMKAHWRKVETYLGSSYDFVAEIEEILDASPQLITDLELGGVEHLLGVEIWS